MNFEKNNSIQKISEKAGFILAYILFTTILFFMLSVIKKETSIFNVIAATASITLIGLLIKRILK